MDTVTDGMGVADTSGAGVVVICGVGVFVGVIVGSTGVGVGSQSVGRSSVTFPSPLLPFVETHPAIQFPCFVSVTR